MTNEEYMAAILHFERLSKRMGIDLFQKYEETIIKTTLNSIMEWKEKGISVVSMLNDPLVEMSTHLGIIIAELAREWIRQEVKKS